MQFLFPVILFCSGIFAQNSDFLYDDSELANIYITIDTTDLNWIYNNVNSDSEHVATFRYVNSQLDETVDSVGFRLRGNTSREAQKKSFKVSFNTFYPGRDFHGVEKLNLNGEHNDPGIIRSKLCWDMFHEIGLPSSRAAHAKVYINDVYYGLYISVEHIDETFLSRNFSDPNGNLWKCLYPANLDYLGEDPNLYKFESNGRQAYDLKTNQSADDYSDLAHLISVLNLTPSSLLPDSLEKLINVPDVLKYFAMDLLLGSWDDYRFLQNNYYLYYEPTKHKFQLIPYDYDNTFGVDWFGQDWWTMDPYDYPNIDGTDRPLAYRLLEINQYKSLFSHFLQFYSENVFDLSLWEGHIDSLKSMITPVAETDIYRTLDYGFTIDDFNNSYTADHYTNQHVKTGLKEFVNERNTSLADQLSFPIAPPIVYRIDWEPKYPGPNDSIHVRISAFAVNTITNLVIQFASDGVNFDQEYPLTNHPVENTKIVEQADLWTGTIPPLGENGAGAFRIYIRDNYALHETYPRNEAIPLTVNGQSGGTVVLNEWLAQNHTVNTDESGEYDDWLELFNTTDSTQDLSGYFLTDDPADLPQWQFPAGTMINPHGYLVIWCDNDPGQGLLHANFKISANGEYLGLTEPDGVTLLDEYTFPAQSLDIAFGRTSDGADHWGFLTPTPGSANQALSTISEGVPDQFSLGNFPNPFNPVTTIHYTLTEDGPVKITVFDLNGRTVAELLDEFRFAGNGHIRFDASNLASGVYFYRIETVHGSLTQKMMLLK